jgi:hypothetical protein
MAIGNGNGLYWNDAGNDDPSGSIVNTAFVDENGELNLTSGNKVFKYFDSASNSIYYKHSGPPAVQNIKFHVNFKDSNYYSVDENDVLTSALDVQTGTELFEGNSSNLGKIQNNRLEIDTAPSASGTVNLDLEAASLSSGVDATVAIRIGSNWFNFGYSFPVFTSNGSVKPMWLRSANSAEFDPGSIFYSVSNTIGTYVYTIDVSDDTIIYLNGSQIASSASASPSWGQYCQLYSGPGGLAGRTTFVEEIIIWDKVLNSSELAEANDYMS